jgi:predicted RNA-binding Zn-ribbon protein involved in translation (DUF1610 family)
MSEKDRQGLVNSFTQKGTVERYDSVEDEFRVIYIRRKRVGWNYITMGLVFLIAGLLVIIGGPVITPHGSETIVVGAICLLTGLGLMWEGRSHFNCPRCLKKLIDKACPHCGFKLQAGSSEESSRDQELF